MLHPLGKKKKCLPPARTKGIVSANYLVRLVHPQHPCFVLSPSVSHLLMFLCEHMFIRCGNGAHQTCSLAVLPLKKQQVTEWISPCWAYFFSILVPSGRQGSLDDLFSQFHVATFSTADVRKGAWRYENNVNFVSLFQICNTEFTDIKSQSRMFQCLLLACVIWELQSVPSFRFS